MRRLPVALLLLLAVVSMYCETNTKIRPSPAEDTILPVHFPSAVSGSVSVRHLKTDIVHGTGDIDETGWGYINLGDGAGDFIVEIGDVSLREFATGATVRSGDITWRVPAPGVQWLEQPEPVIVTPERHIAWAASGDIDKFNEWLGSWESVVTCGNKDELRGTLSVSPYVPVDGANKPEALTPAVWAHLLWGGRSKLAVMINTQAHLPAHARLNIHVHVHQSGLDAATDGRIDAVIDGIPVVITESYTLDPAYMRQMYSQAIRQYADGPHNPTNIDSLAIIDLLQCISANSDPRWGSPGTTLDIEPPGIISEVPTEGTVISGKQDYRCNIHDSLSNIAEVDAAATRAGERLSLLTEEEITIDGQDATYTAVADTHLAHDGEITFTCSASDQWGNSGAKIKQTTSNNDAGSVVVAEPEADTKVSGDRVFVRCACEDDHIADCYLSQPTVDSAAVTELDDDRYILDTTGYPDGHHAIECSLRSAGIDQPISSSIQVEFDNLDPTTWKGRVSMDSPVVGLSVDAQLAFDDGTLGPVFATSTTDGMGRFEFEMPDNISGWVLLTAYGIDATFRNGAVPMDDAQRGAIVRFRAGDKLWLLEHYNPSRPAEPLDGLSINLYSTAIAKLAFVLHNHGDALSYAASEANYMIGRILDQQNGLDVGRTLVRDFVTDSDLSELTDRASTRLGLGHVGLSRRGAEIAIEAGDHPNALNSLYLLPYILRDLENAILEGRDGQDATISVTPLYDINHLTMRWELATAIARWLDNAPLGDTSVAMNRTGLSAKSFSGYDGFLIGIAENTSDLFPHDALPPNYDQESPISNITKPRPNAVLAYSIPEIEAFCTDNVRVERLVLSSVGLSSIDRNASPEALYMTGVDTSGIGSDGSYTVSITCYDVTGYSHASSVDVMIDRTQPTVQCETVSSGNYTASVSPDTTWVPSRDITMSGVARDSHSGIREVQVNGSRATINQEGNWAAAVTLNSDYQTISVVAIDHAGHQASVIVGFSLDDIPPVIDTATVSPHFVVDNDMIVGRLFDLIAEASDRDLRQIEIIEPESLAQSSQTGALTLFDVDTRPFESQGTLSILIRATDAVGLSDDRRIELVIDRQGPQITPLYDGRWITESLYELSGIAQDRTGVIDVRVDGALATGVETWTRIVNLEHGSNLFLVEAEDLFRNASDVRITINADLRDPEPTIDEPQDGVPLADTFTISASASDDGSGIASLILVEPSIPQEDELPDVLHRLVIPLVERSQFGEGPVTFRVRACDNAGRCQDATIQAIIDFTAPSFEVHSHGASTWTSSRTVNLYGTVADTYGVARVQIRNHDGDVITNAVIDGESWSSVIELDTSPQSITLVATDRANNETTRSLTFNVDEAPPSIEVLSPVSGSTVGRSMTVSVATRDNNVLDRVEIVQPAALQGMALTHVRDDIYELDGVDTAPIGESADMVVRAHDHVGLYADSEPTSIHIDRAGPSVSVTSHEADAWVGGSSSISLSGTVDDSSGVDRVEITGATVTRAGTTWSADLSLTSGTNTWDVVAYDSFDNGSTTAFTLHADLTVPVIDNVRILENATIHQGVITLEVVVSDNRTLRQNAGIVNAEIVGTTDQSALGLPDLVVYEGNTMNVEIAVDTTRLPSDGSHTVRVNASDQVGNQSSISEISFVTDNSPPSFGIVVTGILTPIGESYSGTRYGWWALGEGPAEVVELVITDATGNVVTRITDPDPVGSRDVYDGCIDNASVTGTATDSLGRTTTRSTTADCPPIGF